MDTNCPICTYDKSERNKIVDWLLSLAVHLEYGGKGRCSFYGKLWNFFNSKIFA